jgi:hypothetical protein
MAGQLRVQTELTVAVHVPEQQRGSWDQARDQYGSAVHYQPMHRTHQVVAAVRNGTAQIGVLPLPQDGEAEPWWPLLAAPGPRTPRIVSKLPFATGNGDGALSIACLDPEPTTEDASYLIVETVDDVSQGALVGELTGRGLPPRRLVAAPAGLSTATRLVLCEVDGHVAAGDSRLAEAGRGRITGLQAIGGYAVPLGRAAMDGNGGGA